MSTGAASPWRKLDGVVIDAIEKGLTPGAAFVLSTPQEILHQGAYGIAEQRPNRRTVEMSTVWDLASLTKILCTAPLFMTWYDQQKIDLFAPLCEVLPEVPPEIRISDCLSHSSGYPAWRPFYAQFLRALDEWGSASLRREFFKTVAKTPLSGQPTIQYAYSDIGFILLGAYAEQKFGQPLHVLPMCVCDPC